MNGDILTLLNFKDLYDYSIERKSILTVTIKEQITPFQFGNIFYEGDFVTKIEEKPNIIKNILAGIYIVKPQIFELIPENEYFGMDTLINKMLQLKYPINKYLIEEYWLDIGREDDYHKAQEIYKDHFKNGN
jgi:NDP-sugar pyrophosphorylase family protein